MSDSRFAGGDPRPSSAPGLVSTAGADVLSAAGTADGTVKRGTRCRKIAVRVGAVAKSFVALVVRRELSETAQPVSALTADEIAAEVRAMSAADLFELLSESRAAWIAEYYEGKLRGDVWGAALVRAAHGEGAAVQPSRIEMWTE